MRRIIKRLHYYKMQLNIDMIDPYKDSPLTEKLMTVEAAANLPTDHFKKVSHKRHSSYLKKYPKLFSGYQFFDQQTGEFVGYCWVMQKGANDTFFRIRNTDAYISEVYISNQIRGKGYGTAMLKHLWELLREKGIHTVTLAVLPCNERAIRCYEKSGFQIVGEIDFWRIGHCSLPYHVV